MAEHDDFSDIILEILDQISGGKKYDYADVESYMLKHHPEWEKLLRNPETRAAVAAALNSTNESARERANAALKAIGFYAKND